jgi:23S rRNA pseudouridine1911/1915/1917 synthase
LEVIEQTASSEDAGKRLDHFLKDRFPEYSRARLQQWIKAGRVLVDGHPAKASLMLRGAERVQLEPAAAPPLQAEPQDLPLEILYEDEAVIAVNKPAGMVVHAGAGVREGTLVNALLHRFQRLSKAGGPERPGIVHRLDRFTSGVILVARDDASHQRLSRQFASRQVEKTYLAMVHGAVRQDTGRIEKPIARDPVRRTRMTTRTTTGRSAVTEYRVLKRFDGFTFLEVTLGTGRTHQIRVHLASLGHPVAGDTLYGAPARHAAGAPRLDRWFLHAWRIRFRSPATGEMVAVTAPLPEELEDWMQALL